jgi:hypothetical protein
VNLDAATEIVFRMEADQDTKGGPVLRKLVAHLDTGESRNGLEVREPYAGILRRLVTKLSEDDEATGSIFAVAPDVPDSDRLAREIEDVSIDEVTLVTRGRKRFVLIDFFDEQRGTGTLEIEIAAHKVTRPRTRES